MTKKQNSLHADYNDEGVITTLYGDTIEEIASQLPSDEFVELTVYNEAGDAKGWVHTRSDWRWK